jgi:hypothetical protein
LKRCAARIQRFLHDYEWLHIAVGVIGNATFFVGSILSLPVYAGWMTVGVWLFDAGCYVRLAQGSSPEARAKFA